MYIRSSVRVRYIYCIVLIPTCSCLHRRCFELLFPVDCTIMVYSSVCLIIEYIHRSLNETLLHN